MYIRKASRTYKGKTCSHFLLVESIFTPKGPRQKVICSLGDLSPRPKRDWLALAHKLESALSGQQELVSSSGNAELERLIAKLKSTALAPAQRRTAAAAHDELVTVRVEGVRCEESRQAGPVHVGRQFWRRLELDAILEKAGLSEGARRLTLAMTLNRLIHPASELAMPEWIRATALPDIPGVDFDALAEDALYRNLDKLHEHRVAVETALADRERNLFGLDQTVFLYDVTSTYFEGRATSNAKAKRGYSRDHRGDCKQVLVGLAVNREGFPLAHEVFAGNRHDSTTLEEMLKALDQRVGLRAEQTVVVDRGMAGRENIERIRARGLHYLVAVSSAGGDREDAARSGRTHLLGDRARAVADTSSQHHRPADRQRDGTPHSQGDGARGDPPGALPAARHDRRNHAPAAELGARRGGPKIVTQKTATPYLSRVRSQKRGSWVSSMPA